MGGVLQPKVEKYRRGVAGEPYASAMITQNRQFFSQDFLAQHSPKRALKEAVNLLHRYQEGASLRLYARKRLRLVVPMAVLVLVTSFACMAGVVGYFSGAALLGMVLAPFVLLGSLFVQAFVLFSWLETRALAHAFGGRKAPALGFPPVPWLLAAIFVAAPILLLVDVAPKAAFALLAVHVLAPIMFARLDR
jgi:hypothetical protein